MERDITLMQEKKQEEFAFLQEIKTAMASLGWNAARLSKESGVNEATISRAFKKGKDISGDNLHSIFKALGLLNSSPVNYGYLKENKSIHDTIEDILTSGNQEAIKALLTGIEGVKKVLGNDEQTKLLRELVDSCKSMKSEIEQLKTLGGSGVAEVPPIKRPLKVKR